MKPIKIKPRRAKVKSVRAAPISTDCKLKVLRELAQDIADNAIAHGFDNSSNDGQTIALIHSEVSEVLEAIRHGNPPDDKIPEFSGADAELADVVIRCLDMAHQRGWRLPEALLAKMEFNRTRPFKHGGKKF